MHLNDINEFLLQDNLFRNKIINESNETNAQSHYSYEKI